MVNNIKYARGEAWQKVVKRVRDGPPCWPKDLTDDPELGLSRSTVTYCLRRGFIKEGIFNQLEDGSYVPTTYKIPSETPIELTHSASDIVHLIEILEDESLHQDSRKKAEYKLWKCCSSDSEIVGGKNDLRSFFIRTLDNFESKKGIVLDHIHHTLERYVAFQLKGDEDILWMKETCYPKLLSLFDESGSIKVRHRILMILSEIYRIDELDIEQGKLSMIIRKKFFDPKEDDAIAIHCWKIFLSQADDKLKETLKEEIFNLARSWETFWCHANDELKELPEDIVSNMTLSEKDILEKRALEVRKEHYGI